MQSGLLESHNFFAIIAGALRASKTTVEYDVGLLTCRAGKNLRFLKKI